MGNELRTDYFGNQVFIAKGRKFRPKNLIAEEEVRKNAFCPFCPGNEKSTPPEISRVEKNGKWFFRLFPNKYPFTEEGEKHYVITESPGHNERLSDLDKREIFELYEFYQSALKKVPGKSYKFLFKNEGGKAGASIPHAHSQLISMSRVPSVVGLEKKFLDFARIRKTEGDMIFFEDDSFYAYCPAASRNKLEAWVVCKRKGSSLGNLNRDELLTASSTLLRLMKKLDGKLKRPSFNVIHRDAPNYHFKIIPRLATWAGVEYGINCYVNSVPPEDAVRFYK